MMTWLMYGINGHLVGIRENAPGHAGCMSCTMEKYSDIDYDSKQ